MRTLKALISKNTLKRAHVWHTIPLKKSELRDGDICMQRDNSVSIYNSKPDYGAFNLIGTGGAQNDPTLLFYSLVHRTFQYFPTRYYTDDLKDGDTEKEYDVIKIIRGLFDPKDVNDPKKVKEFLEDNSNYEKYFN